MDEIRYYNQKFGIKTFSFAHDAFTVNGKLVSEVCDRLIESGLNIRWKCTTRINCITEELVLKMKQAGMVAIEMGIETGSKRMQKVVNKKLDLDRVKPMVEFLLKNKIQVALFFMHGFPEETEEDLNETLELLFSLLDMGIHYASMSFCMFNPATALTQKHFEELVFDPEIKIHSRGIFGYQEELPVIKENKAMFPFFFHLDTPLRKEYQYLGALVFLYRRFPRTIWQLRSLYHGDNLRFYKDFYGNNLHFFARDIEYLTDAIKQNPMEILNNTIKDFDLPYIRQLKALLKYDCDLQKFSHAEDNTTRQETYDFSYVDFKLKLPIAQYSEGKTEILFQKINGKVKMKVLRIS